MNDDGSERKTLFILLGIFTGILLAGYFLRHTFSALLTSLAFAYLLNPLLTALEKRGFDRLTALILLYGLTLCAALFASFLIIPYLVHQGESLITSLPRNVQNISAALDGWKMRMTPYYAGEEGAWLIERTEASIARLTQELSGSGLRQVKSLFFGVFDLMLAPILVFLILYYKEFFKVIMKRMLPHHERHRLALLGTKINRSLERFVLGMVLDCLMVGILTAVALNLLGIEFPLINGLFAGFATIVPYLGIIVAIIPAAFFGYAKNGDITIIPKVCMAYFLIHVVLEGSLIKPLVMRRTLTLNPLAVIFALMAMGELLGFWGIVLAIPLAAAVKICACEFKKMIATPRHEQI